MWSEKLHGGVPYCKILKGKKMKAEIIGLFSTPVVKVNIGRNFTKKELDCITSIPTIKVPTPLHSQQGRGSQSEFFDIFDNEKTKEGLKDIKAFCEHQLKRYLENIEGVNTDITNLRITYSWLNKVSTGEITGRHIHTNSYLSGVLYIHCLPNDTIHFTNRNGEEKQMELPKRKITQFNTPKAVVGVKEGDFIMFSSGLPHQVGLNETTKERLSLSFDTVPTYLPSIYPPFK